MGQDFSSIVHNEDLADFTRGGFSDKQRDAIKSLFFRKSGNVGEMSLPQFAQLLNLDTRLAKPVFELFDMDGNGKVDDYEFICGLALFTKTSQKQRLEALFNLFDINHSQTIDPQEFHGLIETILKSNSTGPVDASKVKQKIQELSGQFFLDKEFITLDQFSKIGFIDEDIRKSLLNLGVFMKDEAEIGQLKDDDLEAELGKFEEAEDEEGDQALPNIKLDGVVGEDNGLFETEDIGEGDQFMAVKPFEGVVKNSVPSDYRPSKNDGDLPNASLSLHYIHGYRCHDARNNIYYSPDGKLVYHHALCGIQLDTKENKQKFVTGNTNDILSMDSWNDLSATGELGDKPTLCIWRNTTMEELVTFSGVMRKGIARLAFSRDGATLACSCMDVDSMFYIWDVQKLIRGERAKALVTSFKGPKETLLDLRFAKDNKTIVAAAKSESYIFNPSGAGYKVSKVSGWGPKTSAKVSTLCVCIVGNEHLLGAINGKILRTAGGNISGVLDGHTASINAMWLRKGDKGFISGGGDGKVIVWDSAFTKANVIDVATFREFPILNPRVRAVCESDDGSKIAIGTRSSNIIEVDTKGTRRLVLNGHFDGELWGLATVPQSDDVITAGEDFMIARWNLREKKLVRAKKIPYQTKVCDVSQDGRLLAVGCLNGHTLILNAPDFSEVAKITDRKQEISELKFSPDGKFLAIASKDSRIRIYSTSGFKMLGECKGHHSRVTHLDWSVASDVVMSNCTSYEILFFKVPSCQRNNSGASAYRDEKWASWTCTLGWPVQGIFPKFTDGTDVNSCTRSLDRTVLATADDFGKVNLYKYPVVTKQAQCNQFKAHSSHVTNVRFSHKEDFLISSGGNDKALIQWKYKTHAGDSAEEENAAVDEEGYDPDEFDSQQREAGGLRDDEMPENLKAGGMKAPEIDLNGGGFELEDMGAGDQFMAVKAFTGDVARSVPTGFKEPPRCNDPPEGNLKLRQAFGFRCHDAKDTAKFLDQPDKVCFITAALGVKMDTNTFEQSFFNLHDEDLVSMDVTKDKRFCATGSMPAKGRSKLLDIFVWDTKTMEKKAHLTGFHKGAVKHLKFSPNGKLLLSVGLDDDNSFAVYDWQNGKMLASSKVDKSPVFDCDWNDDNTFATITKDSIKFWTLQRGGCSAVKGSWGKDAKVVLASCKYVKGVCYTGSWNGTIIAWSGGSKGKSTPAHGKSPVFCLHYDSAKDELLSGGKDGRVIAWKASAGNLTQSKVLVEPSADGHQLNGGIRSIDSHPSGTYLIGTRQAELFTIAPDGTNNVFMMGHYDGELWALACHPKGTLFVTAGDDAAIHTYNLETMSIEDLYYHTQKIRGVDWSSNGEMIVAADYDGKILLFSPKLDLLDEVQSGFGKGQWIEEIKFSPDSQMVAFGSHMAVSKLEIMQISNGKLQKGTQFNVGLTSALLHLDWSENSDFIVMNSQAYEIRWADVRSRKNISASAAKDINWATWTCKIGFPVQGIFPGVDGTDVNTVCRAANKQVMATGDDFQKVNLFRYPSVKPKSGCKKYTAHSSHVTRVRFMLGDNALITVGGNDKTILVWETDFGKADHPGAAQFFQGAKAAQAGEHEEEEDEDPNAIMGIPILPAIGDDEIGDQSMPVRKKQKLEPEGENLNGFEVEEVGDGDQFMAVLPWLGAIKAPSNWTDPPAQYDRAPKVKYVLDYVYGYRARDKRNNIFYLNNGDIAYYAAAVGIIHNTSSNTQRHLIKHNDDIISMAVHPDKVTIATGELGPKPQVIIWNSLTGEPIATIKNGLTKGVDNLAFSESGKYLAATCMDPDHKVVVFDASNGYSLVASEKGGPESILALAWTSDSNFATGGIKNYNHWTLSGASLKGTKGSIERSTSIVSMAKCDNTILAGTATGVLMVFSGSSASKNKQLHKGFLDTICVGQSAILTGGKDAKINILSFTHDVIATLEISAAIPTSFDPHVRALSLNEATGKLAVGLYSSEVYECMITPLGAGCKITNVKQVNQGHFAKNLKWNNEVWGLAVVDDDTFLTCSDDGTLRKWSASRRVCIASKNLNVDNSGVVMGADPKTNDLRDCSKLRSIAVHPSGLIAIGTADGSIRMASQKNNDFVSLGIFRHQTRWVQELKFSPDGKKLAIGSHDAFINIYSVEKNLKLKYKIKKHSSAITHIDWSLDSNYIHSNCQAYELLFFDSNSGKQVTGGATMLRDEDWATWTAVLGWPVKGIWRTEYKGSDIDAVDRSSKSFDTGYRLLATAEDCSLIRLYRYPCLKKNSDSVDLKGHSSHVTNVRFNPSCSFIFSTGGEDQTVMQWKLAK